MSQKEVDRALVLAKVKATQITLKQAAREMNISYPQSKRLWSRYKKEGPKGLISRKRGVKSNHAVPKEERKKIVRIISEHYQDCKPLFISEKLEQHHGIKYSSEFIRQVMIEYHLWFPKANKAKRHPRRIRRASEGELLQGDASDHDWFEGRGPRCHLHLFVDDATSKIAGGWFGLEETTEGYYQALGPILEEKGRPVNIYTDKRGTFVVNQGNKRGKTQFARAMKELEINMIIAHSPQAKGRIERAFGTLQERLVWEMRINRICTTEEANSYLPKFFEEYNSKYGEQPSNPIDAYRPLNQYSSLKYILSTKEERKVSKNLEVQYKNQIYQLSSPIGLQLSLKNAIVSAITTLNGELAFEYQGHLLKHICYSELEYKEPEICIDGLLANWKDGRGKKTKPSKHHPWKRVTQAQAA
jgi:transposase